MLDLYHRGAEVQRQTFRNERIEHAGIEGSLSPDYLKYWMTGSAEVFRARVIPMTTRVVVAIVVVTTTRAINEEVIHELLVVESHVVLVLVFVLAREILAFRIIRDGGCGIIIAAGRRD